MQSPGKAKGLFAAADIKAGEVIMYEQAISGFWDGEERSYVTFEYNARKVEAVRKRIP